MPPSARPTATRKITVAALNEITWPSIVGHQDVGLDDEDNQVEDADQYDRERRGRQRQEEGRDEGNDRPDLGQQLHHGRDHPEQQANSFKGWPDDQADDEDADRDHRALDRRRR